MEIEEAKLLDYAIDMFQKEKYAEALEAFVLCYTNGYEREWVIETIYSCYMAGNEQEFINTYVNTDRKMSYEECLLDFIPYKEGEYYIFDKKLMCFRGIVSISEIENAFQDTALQQSEFSNVALDMNWNWNELKHVITAAKERKIYVVCKDMKRGISFFKIPELKEYAKNIVLFADWKEYQEYFHEHTSVYLPKIFCGTSENGDIFLDIFQQEHAYRLTPEGRNTENVLLTIAIPTYNRGKLVHKRLENLRKMIYDSEVEIVISRNGEEEYQNDYIGIESILDARIRYYDHEKSLRYTINWHYTVEMAHGKYVLFVSDEDDVILDAIEHYLTLLTSNPDVNLVRAKTMFQYKNIKNAVYGRKGLDAFKHEFLRQNYLSGLIVRKQDFIEADLLKYEQYQSNPFYSSYPHEWWCATLSLKGDFIQEPVPLIAENESMLEIESQKAKKIGNEEEAGGVVEGTSLPLYATYEARLEQFQGMVEFLHIFMKKNMAGAEIGLSGIIHKISYLMEMAKDYGYALDDYENKVSEFLWKCMDAIDSFAFTEEQKRFLLMSTRQIGIEMLNEHR